MVGVGQEDILNNMSASKSKEDIITLESKTLKIFKERVDSGNTTIVLIPSYTGDIVNPSIFMSLVRQRPEVFVYICPGFSDIASARSFLITMAYDAGFEKIVFIDSDIEFTIEQFSDLVDNSFHIFAGIYPVKDDSLYPVVEYKSNMDKDSRFRIVEGVGAGFLKINRDAIRLYLDRTKDKVDNLKCVMWGYIDIYPLFFPMMVRKLDGRIYWYQEDWAFINRMGQERIYSYADTSLKVTHVDSQGKKYILP